MNWLIAILIILAILGIWYYFTDITQYEYICANCGTLKKTYEPPEKNTEKCSACSKSQLVPTATPRGRELKELYNGSTGVEDRVRNTNEAAKKLVERLEGAVPPSGIANELEKLAELVHHGALTQDEWQRAKASILGQPKNKQDDAIERVGKLYLAYKSGALSQSEFNATKWDILSRVGQ